MSLLEIGLRIGFLIVVWRLDAIQRELSAVRKKLDEASPATKDDLDEAVSQIVDALESVELAVAASSLLRRAQHSP